MFAPLHQRRRVGARLGFRRASRGARDLPVAIQISRAGQVLFHAAMPGTAPDNDSWVARKTRVVTRFGHSSLYMGQKARDAGTTFEEYFDVPIEEYAFHGGGFPLTVKDVGVVGAIVVSGLPQLEDHALVVQVLALPAAPRLRRSNAPPSVRRTGRQR